MCTLLYRHYSWNSSFAWLSVDHHSKTTIRIISLFHNLAKTWSDKPPVEKNTTFNMVFVFKIEAGTSKIVIHKEFRNYIVKQVICKNTVWITDLQNFTMHFLFFPNSHSRNCFALGSTISPPWKVVFPHISLITSNSFNSIRVSSLTKVHLWLHYIF